MNVRYSYFGEQARGSENEAPFECTFLGGSVWGPSLVQGVLMRLSAPVPPVAMRSEYRS